MKAKGCELKIERKQNDLHLERYEGKGKMVSSFSECSDKNGQTIGKSRADQLQTDFYY